MRLLLMAVQWRLLSLPKIRRVHEQTVRTHSDNEDRLMSESVNRSKNKAGLVEPGWCLGGSTCTPTWIPNTAMWSSRREFFFSLSLSSIETIGSPFIHGRNYSFGVCLRKVSSTVFSSSPTRCFMQKTELVLCTAPTSKVLSEINYDHLVATGVKKEHMFIHGLRNFAGCSFFITCYRTEYFPPGLSSLGKFHLFLCHVGG